jgi:ribosomal RNA-processing protein 8
MRFAGGKAGKLSTLDKMKAQLQGGRFRMLNERLYTSQGDDAFQLMQVCPLP